MQSSLIFAFLHYFSVPLITYNNANFSSNATVNYTFVRSFISQLKMRSKLISKRHTHVTLITNATIEPTRNVYVSSTKWLTETRSDANQFTVLFHRNKWI